MSVDPRLTIRGIQELQRANAKMIKALKPEGARGRAVQYGLTAGQRKAQAITHVGRYLVGGAYVGGGSLKASHRMKYDAGGGRAEGTIYIDPTTRNPVTNALPSIYGVYEHGHGGTHRFYERVVEEHGKSISDGMIRTILKDFPTGNEFPGLHD